MAFALATVRANLASALSALTGWETYSTVPDNPIPPCVVVQPTDGNYHEAMQAGLTVVKLDLVLIVSSVVSDEDQATLDGYLSSGTGQTKSVIDVLQGNTLSGACKQVHVVGFGSYGAIEMPDERRFFGAVVNIDVHCDRK
jgi:hypothetical protein